MYLYVFLVYKCFQFLWYQSFWVFTKLLWSLISSCLGCCVVSVAVPWHFGFCGWHSIFRLGFWAKFLLAIELSFVALNKVQFMSFVRWSLLSINRQASLFMKRLLKIMKIPLPWSNNCLAFSKCLAVTSFHFWWQIFPSKGHGNVLAS